MRDEASRPLLNDPSIHMGTLCKKIEDTSEAFDPNVVKVVFDEKGFALYFSRAPIPWDRDLWAGKNQEPGVRSQMPGTESHMYKHIGLYVYRRDFLLSYSKMPPTPLEEIEKLEQLRAL